MPLSPDKRAAEQVKIARGILGPEETETIDQRIEKYLRERQQNIQPSVERGISTALRGLYGQAYGRTGAGRTGRAATPTPSGRGIPNYCGRSAVGI